MRVVSLALVSMGTLTACGTSSFFDELPIYGATTSGAGTSGSTTGRTGTGTTGSQATTSGTGTTGTSSATTSAGNTTGTTTSGNSIGTSSSGTTTSGTTTGTSTGGDLPPGTRCSSNSQCSTHLCGVSGVGNCCNAACQTGDAQCGATGCDSQGACNYPDPKTFCGDGGSCAGTLLTTTMCDGMGICLPPTLTDCAPFACTPSGCFSSCSTNANCSSGTFCDTGNGVCCSGLGNGDTLRVDGRTGSDQNACCGVNSNVACQTLSRAMGLIDNAQAQNVTITATLDGGTGNWDMPGEIYPINLGWGVELSAPGIFFQDPNSLMTPGSAIFDVTAYAADTLHYASIAGSTHRVLGIGMDASNAIASDQTNDLSAIAVEDGQTLYLANARVNGSRKNLNNQNAILIEAGATLWLGTDQSGTVTGKVQIGNDFGDARTDGWRGLVCGTDGGKGCTIRDAALTGMSSVTIQGQWILDIDVEDFGNVALTSSPVIGSPPTRPGFGNCVAPKSDGANSGEQAIILAGPASMTLSNAVIQCIGGIGFLLQGSLNQVPGTPTLTLDNTVIQNTNLGILAYAGTATLTNTSIEFNAGGVQQDSDGAAVGSIDLSGGGNSVICSSSQENPLSSGIGAEGVDVYNATDAGLKADNVAWDTAEPDSFSCDELTTFATCACNLTTCSNTAPFDDMDAVQRSGTSGAISQTGATQSSLAVDAGCL